MSNEFEAYLDQLSALAVKKFEEMFGWPKHFTEVDIASHKIAIQFGFAEAVGNLNTPDIIANLQTLHD